jgi:hypothetical protein
MVFIVNITASGGIGCVSLSHPWWLGEKISKVGAAEAVVEEEAALGARVSGG